MIVFFAGVIVSKSSCFQCYKNLDYTYRLHPGYRVKRTMADDLEENGTDINYSMIINSKETKTSFEKKSCTFSQKIQKTIHGSKIRSPLHRVEEKFEDFPNHRDLKQHSVALGNTPIYHRPCSPCGVVQEEKSQNETPSKNKENVDFQKTRYCKSGSPFAKTIYKKKNSEQFKKQVSIEFGTNFRSQKKESQILTLDPKSSQLVLSGSGKRSSKFVQLDQTLFYSCTPEQLSLHNLRCSIYSSLGGSWSIINRNECKRVCFQCFNKRRVKTFNDLTPGDHIAIHRWVGYEHHAIVVDIYPNEEDNTRGTLRVIHRSAHAGEVVTGILLCIITVGQYGNLAYLREEDVLFDLKKQEVYIIEYKNSPFTRSKIVRRAQAEVANPSPNFNIAYDNCEHFANWCAAGEYYSHQIGLLKGTLQNLLFSDNEGYNRMLKYLSENGLMCDDCLKRAQEEQEKFRLVSK